MSTSAFALQYAGARVLRTAARAVHRDEFGKLAPLLGAMEKLITCEKAQGLCAPQLGAGLRLFMLAADREEDVSQVVAINPQILRRSRARSLGWEACLSVPNHGALVSRPRRISVSYETLDGESVREEEMTGDRARAFQHEMDHLDGVLYTARMIPNSLTHTSVLRDVRERNRIAYETREEESERLRAAHDV